MKLLEFYKRLYKEGKFCINQYFLPLHMNVTCSSCQSYTIIFVMHVFIVLLFVVPSGVQGSGNILGRYIDSTREVGGAIAERAYSGKHEPVCNTCLIDPTKDGSLRM